MGLFPLSGGQLESDGCLVLMVQCKSFSRSNFMCPDWTWSALWLVGTLVYSWPLVQSHVFWCKSCRGTAIFWGMKPFHLFHRGESNGKTELKVIVADSYKAWTQTTHSGGFQRQGRVSGWSLNKCRPLAVSRTKKDDRSSNDADNRELTFQRV